MITTVLVVPDTDFQQVIEMPFALTRGQQFLRAGFRLRVLTSVWNHDKSLLTCECEVVRPEEPIPPAQLIDGHLVQDRRRPPNEDDE